MNDAFFENLMIEYSWRKSISIQVLPDLTIKVKAPKLVPKKKVLEWVLQKKPWIEKKLVYYKSFPERDIEKKYVNGESHYFQGQKYPLQIEMGQKNLVCLEDNFYVSEKRKNEFSICREGRSAFPTNSCFFRIITKSTEEEYIEKLLDRWYRDQAWDIFQDVLEMQFARFAEYDLLTPTLKIRKMKSRWGSCSRKGVITLNLKLIQTPSECLRYVVVHELCHLIEHNHGKGFYRLQEKFFPKWKEMKKELVKFHLMGD